MKIFMIIGVAFLTLFSSDLAAQTTNRGDASKLVVGIVTQTADLDESFKPRIQELWIASRQEGIRQTTDRSTLTPERRRELQSARWSRFLTSLESEGILNQQQFTDLQNRLNR